MSRVNQYYTSLNKNFTYFYFCLQNFVHWLYNDDHVIFMFMYLYLQCFRYSLSYNNAMRLRCYHANKIEITFLLVLYYIHLCTIVHEI